MYTFASSLIMIIWVWRTCFIPRPNMKHHIWILSLLCYITEHVKPLEISLFFWILPFTLFLDFFSCHTLYSLKHLSLLWHFKVQLSWSLKTKSYWSYEFFFLTLTIETGNRLSQKQYAKSLSSFLWHHNLIHGSYSLYFVSDRIFNKIAM